MEKTEEAIVNPDAAKLYLSKIHKRRPGDLQIPELLILTYGQREFDYGKTLINGETVKWWPYDGRLAVGKFQGRMIGISHTYIGAPAAVMMLEELITHGARKIVEAGLAGGIDPTLQPSDLCTVTRALSDEGTSRHYFPKRRTFSPSSRLTLLLSKAINKNHLASPVATVWTTDGVYKKRDRKYCTIEAKVHPS